MNHNPDWSDILAAFPKLRDLQSYWIGLNDGRPVPRAAIDPTAIKPLLPYLLLAEFEWNPFRVKYRLTGTWIDITTGYALSGRYLDEFAFEPLTAGVSQMMRAYEAVARSEVPYYVGTYEWPSPFPSRARMPVAIFPLTVNGKISQAISIEEIYLPNPTHRTRSWREYVATHAAGGLSEAELLTFG